MTDTRLYIGLISGTSVDGLDAALIAVDPQQRVSLLAGQTFPFSTELGAALKVLIRDRGGSFDAIGRADVALGEASASACRTLLEDSDYTLADIDAIGSHGQTIWHSATSAPPFTLQIGDPSVVAARTGAKVVADFRRGDIALGGQAAPLAPPFHAVLFASGEEERAVLNLGGIANLSLFDGDAAGVVNDVAAAKGRIRGFDTGPANALLDAWCENHGHGPFDRDGQFARRGRVLNLLLDRLLSDPYFAAPAPKSTGKEKFHLDWLREHLATPPEAPAAEDVQATLTELSAKSVADALLREASSVRRLIVCGGGSHNGFLLERLAHNLPGIQVAASDALGVDPDLVEAALFGWLAHRRLGGRVGAFASVTGARTDSVIGAVYP